MIVGTRGLGWQRDLPDARDFSAKHPRVAKLFDHGNGRHLPTSVDLREYLPPTDDQGSLNASPAFAVLAMVAYLEARTHGRNLRASRLFLYQATLKALKRTGNSPIDLRSTLKALCRFGVPPEQYWPYDSAHAALDPTDGFLYSFRPDYKLLYYARLDGSNGSKTLRAVKNALALGLPISFGFAVPNFVGLDAEIPLIPKLDFVQGGQAVLAVGYDDRRRIASNKGALLFRNSWGNEWGDGGYGWLSYDFLVSGLAADFWITLRSDWLKRGELFSS
jgi:C1A family cysteine protease